MTSNKIPLSPIHRWLEQRTGLSGDALTREALLDYQLKVLREQMHYARSRSRFYAETLRDVDIDSVTSLDALEKLPLCSAADIAKAPDAFLCVPQRDVARITTLFTSGSTGKPKRIFFSENDLEIMVQFFHWGMSCMADESDTVLILMPSETTWSVGDVLKRGLERLGARYVEYGPIRDYTDAVRVLRENDITCMVGIPSQVYRLAKLAPEVRPRTVLLSADYVPISVRKTIETIWGAEVFDHYGLTETGLAGGVECHAHEGYHMRDADMLFEIIDPETGHRVPDGTMGEVVLSTLNRQAMPLIRYRTGDRAAFLPGSCPCGAAAARIGKIQGRIRNDLVLPDGDKISIHALDEVLYAQPPVLDYTAELTDDGKLILSVLTVEGTFDIKKIELAVRQTLQLHCPMEICTGEGFFTKGTFKREITTKNIGED
ncbi:MAG: AMP-binding protein [Eubacteriales bacterium]|nr:AMP-binding protein [Eubacteriales bacterium]